MNYWIFTVTTHEDGGETFRGEDIFRQRMLDKFWGLGERTPNRTALRKGDQLPFYIGLPAKAFAGSAVLASDSLKLSDEERERVSHGKNFYRAEFGVWLDQIQIWDSPRPIEYVLPQLTFIENKAAWFAYLQGGVRKIPDQDFRVLSRPPSPSLHTCSRPKRTLTVSPNLRLKVTWKSSWTRIGRASISTASWQDTK